MKFTNLEEQCKPVVRWLDVLKNQEKKWNLKKKQKISKITPHVSFLNKSTKIN